MQRALGSVGLLLTLLGCGGTTEEDCAKIVERIQERADKEGIEQPCGALDGSEPAAPGYEPDCDALRQCWEDL